MKTQERCPVTGRLIVNNEELDIEIVKAKPEKTLKSKKKIKK